MKTLTARVVTTHVDRHGDVVTLAALEDMVEQVKAAYIPMFIEHDPRIPPQGRVTSAEITPRGDGEFAIDAKSSFLRTEMLSRSPTGAE